MGGLWVSYIGNHLLHDYWRGVSQELLDQQEDNCNNEDFLEGLIRTEEITLVCFEQCPNKRAIFRIS